LKILHVALEPLLDGREIVSGNAIRANQLRAALLGAGHQVDHIFLTGEGGPRSEHGDAFRNSDDLQGIILEKTPDVILLSYWELAGLLPFDLRQPVVLDFVAPRPLEALYESPHTARDSVRRLRSALHRCDLILVGNEQQRHLLIYTLIEAGFDLRKEIPILRVPLGAPVAGRPARTPGADGWLMVAGGVTWPWRVSNSWMQSLAEAARHIPHPVKIVEFDGAYRWHDEEAVKPRANISSPSAIERRPLLPYDQFGEFLTHEAHIGIELADWNVERVYSQSFRSLEFLRHGIPLMCNRHLPLAQMIGTYDAGWPVDSPDQLRELLTRITADPGEWQAKSAGALRLAQEILQPERSVRPLIDWLHSPAPAPRLPAEKRDSLQPPVLGVPPWKARLRRQRRLLKQALLRRLFGQRRSGHGVLIVTRGDLFPADHGAAVRTVETACALAESGIAVGIVTDSNSCWFEYSRGEFKQRRFPFWVRLFSPPAPLVKLLHYSKDLPLSNSFLYLPMSDSGFFWRTLAGARKIRAGILQAEFPAYARPCIKARDLLDCRVVLVEHNIEYERLRSQVAELTDGQYRNLRKIELDLCARSDAVVCVSDNDRQILFAAGLEPDLLHTIMHGVDLRSYQAPAMPGVRQRFSVSDDEALLIFHGTFSYPPNRKAIQVFADILLPGLEKRGLRCHVLAVGKDSPPDSPHPRIHYTGSVSEMAPWLKAADLAVIPLTDGGGTRMKIIDCFAAGLPVVSTGKGIEGIPVEPGRHAVITDDWEEMMDAIVALWHAPQKRDELARAGAAVAAGLDWSEIARRYRSLYSSLR